MRVKDISKKHEGWKLTLDSGLTFLVTESTDAFIRGRKVNGAPVVLMRDEELHGLIEVTQEHPVVVFRDSRIVKSDFAYGARTSMVQRIFGAASRHDPNLLLEEFRVQYKVTHMDGGHSNVYVRCEATYTTDLHSQ